MIDYKRIKGSLSGLFFKPSLDTCLVSILLIAPLVAVPVPSHAQGSETASTPRALQTYLDEALAQNPNLAQADFELEAERQRLENLRARYYPSLNLQARISVSEGGRTIDFPAGDLLNPVYNALNAQAMSMGQPARFPNIENQSIPLLRPTEQDTRLQLRGPIYEPALNAQVNAQRQVLNAQHATRQQVKEELLRDLQVAYWQIAQATARVTVLQASLNTLKENERVNLALYKAGETTLDAPKRAQAETLNIAVALRDAQKQTLLAREYFNLLRFAPPNSEVDVEQTTPDEANTIQLLNTLQPTAAPAGPPPALTRLERSLEAQRAAMQAAKASYKPTLGYSIEGGNQGKDYSNGPNAGFATASVVMNWTLADGGIRSSEVARAQARTSLYGSSSGVNQQLGLRSDMAGVVVERNLNPGQEVRPDGAATPLFVVSDPSMLWVSIDAQEADVRDLRPGAKVQLLVPSLPDQKLQATISAVTDQIDPSTRTIKIRATVSNPQRWLKNEMLAKVRYERQVGNSIEVPATAVFLRGNQHYVFVQSQAGVFEPRDVKVSYEGTQKVLLSSGLKEGEQVVSQNGLLLARELRIAQEAAHAAEQSKP